MFFQIFSPASCRPKWNGTEKNPFCDENVDVDTFLHLNSQGNHLNYCLVYAFTYRDFADGVTGLAWTAMGTKIYVAFLISVTLYAQIRLFVLDLLCALFGSIFAHKCGALPCSIRSKKEQKSMMNTSDGMHAWRGIVPDGKRFPDRSSILPDRLFLRVISCAHSESTLTV